MKVKIFFTAVLMFLASAKVMSQDLDAMLDSQTVQRTEVTTGTFKATRLINGQSIERMQQGQLDFRIDHRFGTFSSGAYNAFGMDLPSKIHITLDFGITDWAMVGLGRTFGSEKFVDGFVKLSPLRQSKGKVNMPVSVSVFLATELKSDTTTEIEKNKISRKMSYTSQILIARKFNESLSLQLMPTYVHRNLVADDADKNDVFAVGIGGRYKLSSRVSINAEYYHVLTSHRADAGDPLAIGFDVETGGHVFQLFVTNAIWNTERGFITDTRITNPLHKLNDVRLGFKISRVFPLIPRKVKGTEIAL
jgi:Membrane bound beta barrel domain (DUF5777)